MSCNERRICRNPPTAKMQPKAAVWLGQGSRWELTKVRVAFGALSTRRSPEIPGMMAIDPGGLSLHVEALRADQVQKVCHDRKGMPRPS